MEEVRKYFVRDDGGDEIMSIEANREDEAMPVVVAITDSDSVFLTTEQARALNMRLVAAINFVDPGGE